ncbi:MAG: hypothetical protein WC274_08040 [Sulfurimonas sp.]|jgi:hypothetical protein
MKMLILGGVLAGFLTGCASKSPIVIEDVVEQKQGYTAVLITAPQRIFSAPMTASMKYLDYYINCLEEKCKVARMQTNQHVVLYVHGGKQTLYVVDTTKEVDLLRDTIIVNTNPVVFEFEAIENTKLFIKHEWDAVSWGTFLPIALPTSHLKVIDEKEAIERMEEVEANFWLYGKRGETF